VSLQTTSQPSLKRKVVTITKHLGESRFAIPYPCKASVAEGLAANPRFEETLSVDSSLGIIVGDMINSDSTDLIREEDTT